MDVGGLRLGQRPHAVVDAGEVDAERGRAELLGALHLDAQATGLRSVPGGLGGGDQGLGGHAVGQDGRTTDPVGVDDRDLGTQLRGHQGRFVSAGTAAELHDACHRAPIVLTRGFPPRVRAVRPGVS